LIDEYRSGWAHRYLREAKAELEAAIKLIDAEESNIIAEAKSIAEKLKGKIPVIYATTYNEGIAIRLRQQLNENAKILCWHHIVPEMNHNELVGWKLNDDILKKIIVIFLKDKNDNERIKLRMNITADIYKKYANNIITLESTGDSKLGRIFDLIYLGDWVSYYLAILNEVNPTPVDVISFLKNKLEKISM